MDVTTNNYLGEDYKVITNSAGDKVFISADGTRKVRFDLKNSHGDLPHVHLEVKSESGIWEDTIESHRIYPE